MRILLTRTREMIKHALHVRVTEPVIREHDYVFFFFFFVIRAITLRCVYSELLLSRNLTSERNAFSFPCDSLHQLASEASAFLTRELTADVWHVVCAGVSLLVSHAAIAEDTSWEMYMLIDQGESRWKKTIPPSFCTIISFSFFPFLFHFLFLFNDTPIHLNVSHMMHPISHLFLCSIALYVFGFSSR